MECRLPLGSFGLLLASPLQLVYWPLVRLCFIRSDFAQTWLPMKDISGLPSPLGEFLWESLLSLALSPFPADSSSNDTQSLMATEGLEGWNGNPLKSGTTGDENEWSTQAFEKLVP